MNKRLLLFFLTCVAKSLAVIDQETFVLQENLRYPCDTWLVIPKTVEVIGGKSAIQFFSLAKQIEGKHYNVFSDYYSDELSSSLDSVAVSSNQSYNFYDHRAYQKAIINAYKAEQNRKKTFCQRYAVPLAFGAGVGCAALFVKYAMNLKYT